MPHNLSPGSYTYLVVSLPIFSMMFVSLDCQIKEKLVIAICTSCSSIEKTLLCLDASFLSDISLHSNYKLKESVLNLMFPLWYLVHVGLRIKTVFPLQAVSPLSQFDCLSCTQSSK